MPAVGTENCVVSDPGWVTFTEPGCCPALEDAFALYAPEWRERIREDAAHGTL